MEQLNKNAMTKQVSNQAPRRKWSAAFRELYTEVSLKEVREIYQENKKINGDKPYVPLTKEQKSIVAGMAALVGSISALFTMPSVFHFPTSLTIATDFGAWAQVYMMILVLPANLRRFLNLEKTTQGQEERK